MRSPARILFVLFTLLLTVQGEPVLGARTKVIVRPAAGRSVPEEAYGICLPVRLSCDGVAVCGYDAQLPTGERVAALSADELAARGVPRLDDVVRQWRGRDLRLFLELCPSAAEPLSEEEHAERELILRRADAATCGAFAAADASCGCCALAEIALRTAYGAGFRQGDVWLIADDAVEIKRVGVKRLVGSAPELIRHYIELRGIGVVDVQQLFGMSAVREDQDIDLVVNLEQWNDNTMYDRLGLEELYTVILDVKVPALTVPVKPGRNLAIIVEVAAMNNRHKKMGYNAAQAFTQQINEHFDQALSGQM